MEALGLDFVFKDCHEHGFEPGFTGRQSVLLPSKLHWITLSLA